jgi:hypothetical protein
MGGEIEVQSNVGEGAKFTVAFPLSSLITNQPNDPHRAKPINDLPEDPVKREEAIQQEIQGNQPINIIQRDYVCGVIEEAARLAKDDEKVVRALREIAAIEIRAGPMPNLFGVVRNNILHIDTTAGESLLDSKNRIELLITLIHEARAITYPDSKDKENEGVALSYVKYEIISRSFKLSRPTLNRANSLKPDSLEELMEAQAYAIENGLIPIDLQMKAVVVI